VASLNPKAVVKSRTSYAKNTVLLVYKNLKEKLDSLFLKDLPPLDLVSFTSDMWQSRATDDYISLTLHYLDKDWFLRHFNVECRPYSSTHAGSQIAAAMDNMIKDVIGLRGDASKYMTTDGAANMKKACEESDEIEKQMICLNHVINLAYKDACKVTSVAAMISMCKSLASAVHYSTKRTNIIRDKAAEMKGEPRLLT